MGASCIGGGFRITASYVCIVIILMVLLPVLYSRTSYYRVIVIIFKNK